MLDEITLIINNKKNIYSKGITLAEVAKEYEDNFKYPILLARVNNRLYELDTPVTEDATVEFLDLTSREGNRLHIAGLTYLLISAIKKMYGEDADIRVEHSLDKGIYIATSFRLTEVRLKALKDTMDDLIAADMPITKVTVDRMEAIEYFNNNHDPIKATALQYNTNTYVNLYRLGNSYNYFFSLMPTSTSMLKAFALTYINENGLVLRFPTPYLNSRIKEYKHHPNMFKVFEESRDWAHVMHIENASDLNRVVSLGKIGSLIRMDETLQSNRLLTLARTINDKKDNIKIVLMAGPSSSGKTTISKKLCMYLESFGLHPRVLSMDDYFVERRDNPIGEDGKPDYECLEALDLELFDTQLAQLLNHETIKTPTYNFSLGKKEFKNEMTLGTDDILVIEGIHALDNHILTNIPRSKKFKIYISALTELNIDNYNRISTSDNRLLRRIIRDNRTRGYDVAHTLEAWHSVREGEEKYIFPYQDEADYTFNSALMYEIGVLKTYVEPLLYSVPSTSPYYEEAKRLINFLRSFLPIPADAIANDSILREFIGGSCFND
jgi:uridine kinase